MCPRDVSFSLHLSLASPPRIQQRARILKWKNDSKSINFPYNNQAIYFHIHLALSSCLTRAACLHYTSLCVLVRSECFISSVCAVIAKERHHRYSSFKSLKMPFILRLRRHRQNVQDAVAFSSVKDYEIFRSMDEKFSVFFLLSHKCDTDRETVELLTKWSENVWYADSMMIL